MAAQIAVHQDDIVMEGCLVKESMYLKIWRKRWFVLTPDYLCAFKSRGDYKNPTEFIRLKQCSTVKSAEGSLGDEHSLCVITPERCFYLIASTGPEKEKWIEAIGRHMVHRTAIVREKE
mmetsp:Transcript_58338/g.92620  ORF Transcript_58338/g.92620 Transcript_58338/m.92620 type:complete len:119 (-) Transcript_58338:232-588(-)|eukprot:CAMPEP_0169119294 /NCGR_PEP_ID=MMETSP1015-20121227/31474_1 /TAXON_ID=342587 /ORGANISM="Karlodinium micrum, Strain CCMP2283" /LENGTH=118 /DNA_ID=CAMNT_0009182153 /DNA_START=66 /DNA_END=422 /DNA_ORIENTATION=+